MKVFFLSNYFNHHQKPLSEALMTRTNQEYCFLSCETMDEDRIKMGWGADGLPDYVKQPQELDLTHLQRADVVIAGSAPEKLVHRLLRGNQLLFRYSERPLKHGNEPLKYVPRLIKWHHNNPTHSPVYLLCASAFTASDYRKFGLFRNRCYQWGYFPETRHYANLDELFERKCKTELLWCGRFLDWKHPDDAIWAAKQLKQLGIPFQMKLIGTGQMEEQLKKTILQDQLGDCVTLLGSMKPDEVRNLMEQAGIFLFTSDRQEGWGAVVNEAMNSGCAVVASHIAGSVPYLIEDGKNGMVYRSGNREQLLERVLELLQTPEEQRTLGENAYHTITDLWNAEVAAERLICLSEHILAGETAPVLYFSGPCSPAEIIEESWYKG
ncbi:MAG: glycosyltransferase [Clostridiales bacterium]|nr:glycosyltransferase [Clostridiales bacterium]